MDKLTKYFALLMLSIISLTLFTLDSDSLTNQIVKAEVGNLTKGDLDLVHTKINSARIALQNDNPQAVIGNLSEVDVRLFAIASAQSASDGTEDDDEDEEENNQTATQNNQTANQPRPKKVDPFPSFDAPLAFVISLGSVFLIFYAVDLILKRKSYEGKKQQWQVWITTGVTNVIGQNKWVTLIQNAETSKTRVYKIH